MGPLFRVVMARFVFHLSTSASRETSIDRARARERHRESGNKCFETKAVDVSVKLEAGLLKHILLFVIQNVNRYPVYLLELSASCTVWRKNIREVEYQYCNIIH